MEEEETIEFIHDEELYNISFPADPERLVQPNDGLDSDDSENEAQSDDAAEISDEEDEPSLLSIVPEAIDSNHMETDSFLLGSRARQVAKARAPVNPRGKNAKHSSDIMNRALVMKLAGLSNKKVFDLLGVPETTVRDHNKRFEERDGQATPVRHKRLKPVYKITEEGSRFLLDVIKKSNTLTLTQMQQLYFKRFNVGLALSTFYRHLVYKHRITIKRANPYPERRTDETTKDMRRDFVLMIENSHVDYATNCVFVDEASVMASMRRNYAWSSVKEPARVVVPHMYTSSRSMLAAISNFGIVEVCTKINRRGLGGGTKTTDFYAFLNLVMDKLDARGLKDAGWSIVCDNAPIHTAHYVRDNVEKRGYALVFLPRYR